MNRTTAAASLTAAIMLHAGLCLCADAPYPKSDVIKTFAWTDDLVKLEPGAGDNWPIAWVEGDLQMTSYGDGDGFSDRTPRLSLGFARITGDPQSPLAVDVASNVDTPMGGGNRAIKASGLLAVGDTLYMFVRNYRLPGSDDFTNSHLAWSTDLGRTWTWADWHFADTFGCPEFVQFGPGYSGARDNYVYIVSQANDSAYDYSPDIVLARVPKENIRKRDRYEFLSGFDDDRDPEWSPKIEDRHPIFTDPNGTQRIAVTFNKTLDRYILTTSHRPPGSNATHTPALGVFDAPEPWGPWTTAYYDHHWSGDSRTYHHKFPPKWMSADGRSMWLLFSGLDGGYYTFCLRRAVLETHTAP